MRVDGLAKLKAFFVTYVPLCLFFAILFSMDGIHIVEAVWHAIQAAFFFYVLLYFPVVRKVARRFQEKQDREQYQRRMQLEFEYWHKRISSADNFSQRTAETLSRLKQEFEQEKQRNSQELDYIIQKIRELE